MTLDGSIVPTSDLAGTLTYVWSQTSGKAVTLSTNGVASTSFTTDALTNFVDMSTTTAPYINDHERPRRRLHESALRGARTSVWH